MRRSIIGLVVLTSGLGCSDHHGAEGTLVEPGPGVQGLPGGSWGVSASAARPVSGGTLLVARDGYTAVAADPERDRVWLVDLGSRGVTEVVLQQGDEPGRAAEDNAGHVHVATRRGGALVSIDLGTGKIIARRQVCASPRGVAFDSARDALHVACETGELVSIGSTANVPFRVLDLGRDLRDVVVDGDRLLVSRFRAAELLVVDASGQITRTLKPQASQGLGAAGFAPSVAWRTIALPGGRVAMLHQRANPGQIAIGPQGYYSSSNPCSGAIVHGAVSEIDPDAQPPGASGAPPVALPLVVGPSDVAVSPDGQKVAIVSIGNSWFHAAGPVPGRGAAPSTAQQLMIAQVGRIAPDQPCGTGSSDDGISGEPTSVAFDGQGRVVVQSREPAELSIVGEASIKLSSDSRADTGIALFHMNSGFGIACASCHPEGGEDGRTWNFAELGARRTQTVAGGVLKTAPFHWNGDMKDFSTLVHEVFVSRMGGPRPNEQQLAKFAGWLDRIPAPKARFVDESRVARGSVLFQGEAGCTSCHAGATYTDNHTYDVGTGGEFQVPSLVGVAARRPFLHDGCASTLRDRFGSCGGGDQHGRTSGLSEEQLGDIVTFLESL